jgi:hypothetical protein
VREATTAEIEKILQQGQQRVNQLSMAEAVVAQDWAEVRRLHAEGLADVAEFAYEIVKFGSMEGFQIIEALPDIDYDRLLMQAISHGQNKIADYILTHKGEYKEEGLNVDHAFAFAVRQKKTDMADLIFSKHLDPHNIDERHFNAVITNDRKDLYFKLHDIKTRAHRHAFFIQHFESACEAEQWDICDFLLPKMKAEWLDYRPHTLAQKFDFEHLVGIVCQTGRVDYLKALFAVRPLDTGMLEYVVAANNKECLTYVFNKFSLGFDGRVAAVKAAVQQGSDVALRSLLTWYPDVLRSMRETESSSGDAQLKGMIFKTFCEHGTSENFFWFMNQDITLPKRANIIGLYINLAMNNTNKEMAVIAEYLMTKGIIDQKAIDELRKEETFIPLLKLTVAFDNNPHFNDDQLFWSAAWQGDLETVQSFPSGQMISVKADIESSFSFIAYQNKPELFDAVFERIPHDQGTLRRVLSGCIKNFECVQKIVEAGAVPDVLNPVEIRKVIDDGTFETFKYLEDKGFTYADTEIPRAIFNKALVGYTRGSSDFAEHFLKRGAALPMDDTEVEFIFKSSDKPTAELLMKWYARALPVADETVLTKPKDTASLLNKQDEFGNNALDILGAHGKLSEVLTPALWHRAQDAVQFMDEHVPPVYLKQCDFNHLSARISQQNLKASAPKSRIKITK